MSPAAPLAAALLFATLAQPAPAAEPGRDIQGWWLESDEINCALTKWVGEDMLMLIGPSEHSAGGLAISSPAIADVRAGDDPALETRFDAEAPVTRAATGVPAAEGEPGGYVILLPLDALVRARPHGFTLTVSRAGAPVYTFDATAAGPGMAALMDCSKAFAKAP